MQKIPRNLPYGIFRVARADAIIVSLYLLKYIHTFQMNLSGNSLYTMAMLITLLILFSPPYIWSSLCNWKRKDNHKHGYDEKGVYQVGQLVFSRQQVESVVFQHKSDSWVRMRLGVWTKAAYSLNDVPRAKVRRRLHGNVTFYPKSRFGFRQMEVTIPIMERTPPMRRPYGKTRAFAASACLYSIFDIITKWGPSLRNRAC